MIPRLPKGISHPMRIGEGSFASVYRVHQHALDRWVAIKLIYERDRKKRHELLMEARTQAQIKATCVPQIYDAFQWNNRICIIMQWVRGVSLLSILESQLSDSKRYVLAHGFITALANLHALGFAHRDLKPANVLISPEDGIYLVDFGFAKKIADINSSGNIAKGTPEYMAPEVWRCNCNIDLMKADLFSAGKILHQILSTTHFESIIEPLLQEDPSMRPTSGVELLSLWNSKVTASDMASVSWSDIAADLSAGMLSTKLVTAARELLLCRKHDEAYWLLVESLEENANNVEAIDLMSRFARNGTSKKLSLRNCIVLISILAALTTAFLAGKKSGEYQETKKIVRRNENKLLLTDSNARLGSCPLKEDSLHMKNLVGQITVEAGTLKGHLLINNQTVDIPDHAGNEIELAPGTYLLTWIDQQGNTCWFEKIRLLPFQKKHIVVKERGL